MELFDAIKRRRSIRNYSGEVLSEEKFGKVRKIIEETRVFREGVPVDSRLIREGEDFQESLSGVIADYGKVEAPHYLAITAEESDGAFVELGYRYEFVVLALTSMNIGTCWIGKGFSDRELEGYVDLPSNQTCRALIAFGPLSNNKLEVIADPKRKEPREFLVDSRPDDLKGSTLKIIDALRRAPSSINSQPWRVLARDEVIHLYIKSRTFLTRKFLENLSNMNRMDAGIGLSHLKVAGEHLLGKVEIEEVDHPSQKNLEYIATMVK